MAKKKNTAKPENKTVAKVGEKSMSLGKPEAKKVTLSPLTMELGREDLNQLVARVNELIEYHNAHS